VWVDPTQSRNSFTQASGVDTTTMVMTMTMTMTRLTMMSE
jgi:hypothetical protein